MRAVNREHLKLLALNPSDPGCRPPECLPAHGKRVQHQSQREQDLRRCGLRRCLFAVSNNLPPWIDSLSSLVLPLLGGKVGWGRWLFTSTCILPTRREASSRFICYGRPAYTSEAVVHHRRRWEASQATTSEICAGSTADLSEHIGQEEACGEGKKNSARP